MQILEKCEDVNTKNQYGWTPLHYAARRGHTEIVISYCGIGYFFISLEGILVNDTEISDDSDSNQTDFYATTSITSNLAKKQSIIASNKKWWFVQKFCLQFFLDALACLT